ncbi:COX15/CtaA family protein [Saliphagus infecundisoli]|uniref:COX15/CtaA family protein n=2 Tax=Saliphagus infecundisoli TaxID=1849069 RepID=A0ABD5QAI0_9EURY
MNRWRNPIRWESDLYFCHHRFNKPHCNLGSPHQPIYGSKVNELELPAKDDFRNSSGVRAHRQPDAGSGVYRDASRRLYECNRCGLFCPDWPTCYGTWVLFLQPDIIANSPYSALQIFAEWAHRGLAMTAGLFIAGTAVGLWIVYPDDTLVKWSATTALVLLPVQVLLGGLTITENLKPIIITTHLGVTTLILLSLLTTVLTAYLRNRRVQKPTV